MKQEEIEQLAEKINIDRAAIDHARILTDAEAALEKSRRPEIAKIRAVSWGRLPRLVWAGGLAAAFLIIVSSLACFVLSRDVADLKHELELARRDVAIARTDDSATINLYLREHQDFIARQASLNSVTSQPVQIRVSQRDIMYYEFIDDQPEYMSPGIIVSGSPSQRKISTSEPQVIFNGHILTLSEAKTTTDFGLVSPPLLRSGYILDQIRRIEDRDALQLLYTNGIDSISLFEQPLDGLRRLKPKDFREYAVYCNQGQAGGTILAWKDDALSYVLIGNIEMSQLIGMAQLINARK